MSLVIAIKDGDRVVFGSDKQASTGLNKSHDTTKIWKVDNLPGAIMGGVGSMRASQIIQYSQAQLIDLNDVALKGGIDTDFIINSLVPSIVEQLRTHGIACEATATEDKENVCALIPNTFLFAVGDRAWMIWHDLSVSELDDYLVIGSGSDVAEGALFATPEKNPFERIVLSIDAAAKSTLYVDDGVDLLSTKPKPKDKQQITKALGLDIDLKQLLTDTTLAALKEDVSKKGVDKKEVKKKGSKKEKKSEAVNPVSEPIEEKLVSKRKRKNKKEE